MWTYLILNLFCNRQTSRSILPFGTVHSRQMAHLMKMCQATFSVIPNHAHQCFFFLFKNYAISFFMLRICMSYATTYRLNTTEEGIERKRCDGWMNWNKWMEKSGREKVKGRKRARRKRNWNCAHYKFINNIPLLQQQWMWWGMLRLKSWLFKT